MNYDYISKNVVDFKIRLESYKKDNISKKGNYWDLSGEIFNRINDSNRESYVVFMQENKHIAKRRGINTSQCVWYCTYDKNGVHTTCAN